MMNESAEQQARDLLERCGVEEAQSFSAGDLVELANLIAELNSYRRVNDRFRRSYKNDNLFGGRSE